MPCGPNGEKQPADVVGCAAAVTTIAAGQIKDNKIKESGRVRSGYADAKACTKNFISEQSSEIMRKTVARRWA